MKEAIKLIEQGLQEIKKQRQDEYAKSSKPSENNRFKILRDGWIFDKALGIEWGPTSEKTMVWKDAKAYADKLGGRLPSVKELRSLVDYEKHDPCIDKDFFSDTKSSWY